MRKAEPKMFYCHGSLHCMSSFCCQFYKVLLEAGSASQVAMTSSFAQILLRVHVLEPNSTPFESKQRNWVGAIVKKPNAAMIQVGAETPKAMAQ